MSKLAVADSPATVCKHPIHVESIFWMCVALKKRKDYAARRFQKEQLEVESSYPMCVAFTDASTCCTTVLTTMVPVTMVTIVLLMKCLPAP